MESYPLKTQGEALFEAVLNTVSDAITVIDKDLKVIFQNKAVYKIYGSKIGERCFEAYRGRQEPCENCIILGACRRTPNNYIDSTDCSLKIEKSWQRN